MFPMSIIKVKIIYLPAHSNNDYRYYHSKVFLAELANSQESPPLWFVIILANTVKGLNPGVTVDRVV